MCASCAVARSALRPWPFMALSSRSWVAASLPSSRTSGAVVEPSPSRSEEHTSELQTLMRISYAVFCLQKKMHLKIFPSYHLFSTVLITLHQYLRITTALIEHKNI